LDLSDFATHSSQGLHRYFLVLRTHLFSTVPSHFEGVVKSGERIL
jgi:hypothetical protein